MFQVLAHHGELADARRPQHEEVVTFAADTDTEVQGLQGPCLANDLLEVFQLRGVVEIELLRVTDAVKDTGIKCFGLVVVVQWELPWGGEPSSRRHRSSRISRQVSSQVVDTFDR